MYGLIIAVGSMQSLEKFREESQKKFHRRVCQTAGVQPLLFFSSIKFIENWLL